MNETQMQMDVALQPKWRSLNQFQRRIVGVLVEKAKTTPDVYPLSINALTNGCNQKSNRSPKMDLTAQQTELRENDKQSQVSGLLQEAVHLLEEVGKVDLGSVEFAEPLRQQFLTRIQKRGKGGFGIIEVRPAASTRTEWWPWLGETAPSTTPPFSGWRTLARRSKEQMRFIRMSG